MEAERNKTILSWIYDGAVSKTLRMENAVRWTQNEAVPIVSAVTHHLVRRNITFDEKL